VHVKAKIKTKVEAKAALGVIVNKCNAAFTAISADVELKAKLAGCTSVQKKLVAKAIADVIVDINAIFVSLDVALLVDADIVSSILQAQYFSATSSPCLVGQKGSQSADK
jgi:hypothetical protein